MKITLCGSTRFMPSFHEWNLRLTKAGHLVYSVAAATTEADRGGNLDPELKLVLDAVHIAKIEESDAVFIITMSHENADSPILKPDPYVGESTAREIYYAVLRNKPVMWDHSCRARLGQSHSTLSEYCIDQPLPSMMKLPGRCSGGVS